MPSAKFTQTYEKISKMGEKLKAAGKQGPSNDEQLNVRSHTPFPNAREDRQKYRHSIFKAWTIS
jgi:diazepam-binding inhibitor (GABA receptor modulating acyl-CoA-binding protein)